MTTKRMTLEAFNAFCASLTGTTHVVQWGNSDVWKVGPLPWGKVFAIGGMDDENAPRFSFKVTELSFEILKEQPGLRPAPYLASRGFTWIQDYAEPGLDADALTDYLRQSYDLVAQGLSKARRRSLGLDPG